MMARSHKRPSKVKSTHDPATPDADVSPPRLAGRRAARRRDRTTEPPMGDPDRTSWWLGWYDERLKRFYA